MAEFGPFEAALVLGLVAGVSILIWYELRVMRRRRAALAERGDLPERSHNALVTTRAIRDAIGRGDVKSPDADILILRAEGAHDRRAYQECIELCGKAREALVRQKARAQAEGDLAKLAKVQGTPDETPHEKLVKETPPNYLQAKFTLNLAQDSIEVGRKRGRDVSAAEALLRTSRASFDAEDYTAALAQALQAKRAAEEALPPNVQVVVEGSPAAVAPVMAVIQGTGPRCAFCGAELRADDEFCRKCGARVARPRACGECGAPLKEGDTFCRKCGAKV
ncbi:MAG TPA: zinc ribbon domain-containing protein [Thermoplasmata archaeon]|nr:zinc ribbon domain-containing protein [Thermoplasmata archaeon]